MLLTYFMYCFQFSTNITGELRGIMFSNGKEWQEQRRFTLKNLRDFGFGKLSMEGLILEEVQKCNEMLSNVAGTTT